MAMAQNEEDTRSMLEVTIHTVILALTTVLALAGNSLVCLALYRNRRLRTTTNFYVLSLAVSDIILAIISPFHLAASWLRRWPFNDIVCQFIGFFVQFWAQVSLCILALSSINRYICVLKPHKYPVFFGKRKTILSIIFIWLFLLLQTLIFTVATPIIYQWSAKSLYCQGTSQNKRTERISYLVFGSLFTVPMLLVVFCYGSVHHVVWKHNTAVAPSLQQTNRLGTISQQEIKTSRVLFAAVLGFCVCWTPLTIVLFLVFGFQVSISSVALWVFVLFSAFSSWINPIIYGVMNRAMRKEFRNILFCRKTE